MKKQTAYVLLILTLGLLGGYPQVRADAPASPTAVFSNPIISGFAPDPSVIRVGNDFYLVNSTFEYFPGIPVYHSTDLVNWTLISYAVSDASQVDMGSLGSSDGIHASTIRHHDGLFYVITTNNISGRMVNFIVTAKNPRGPWSKPYVLDDAPGIDPSLFFDDDGRAWYVGNHMPPDPEFPGQAEIWLQELDLAKMNLVGEKHYLWRGCCGGVWAEGPHIYKRDGYYYLMISEGGTAFEHALAVAISKDITGPYQNNPRNPVLSHRQLSYDHPITGVGHADLVELEDGRWYAVALGWRLVDGEHGTLGRETFLVPVQWETEPYHWKEEKLTFPVFSPASGRIELHFPMPFANTTQHDSDVFVDDFESPQLGMEWNFRRAPERPFYSLTDYPGSLRVFLQAGQIAEKAQYSFAGIRQRHFQFDAVTEMTFSPATPQEEAGLVVIQNDRSAFLMTLSEADDGPLLTLKQSLHGELTQLAQHSFEGDRIFLKVSGDYLNYGFFHSADGQNWETLKADVDGTALSPAAINGYNYTGVYIGLYASSNGASTENFADFGSFRYQSTATGRDDWYERQLTR
jgi:xylan 1,4-beta-xylosidase